jgi:hypothetical protein
MTITPNLKRWKKAELDARDAAYKWMIARGLPTMRAANLEICMERRKRMEETGRGG